METCEALDPNDTNTLWYCTLLAGHDAGAATITHSSEYPAPDEIKGPPFVVPAFHTWTVTT